MDVLILYGYILLNNIKCIYFQNRMALLDDELMTLEQLNISDNDKVLIEGILFYLIIIVIIGSYIFDLVLLKSIC